MVFPFRIICMWWHLLLVKFTCVNLSSLSLINHCLVRLFSLSAAVCNFSVASSTLSPTAMMAVSSAKVATVVPSGCRRSLVYNRYRTVPNTHPFVTPALMGLNLEYIVSGWTLLVSLWGYLPVLCVSCSQKMLFLTRWCEVADRSWRECFAVCRQCHSVITFNAS